MANGKIKQNNASVKAPINKAVKATGTGSNRKGKAPPKTGPNFRRDAGGKV